MSKAKEKELAELHSIVANKIKDKLNDKDCSIKDIELAIRFLKDNEIKCDKDLNPILQDVEEQVNIKTLPFSVGE